MNEGIKIRPARSAELPTLARLIENQLPDMMAGAKRPGNIEQHLSSLIPDRSLILATRANRLAGLTAVDLDHSQILTCYLDPKTATSDTPRQLFGAAEKLAVSFGTRVLHCRIKSQVEGFMRSIGYRRTDNSDSAKGHCLVEKDLLEQAKPELRSLIELLDDLAIPSDYGVKHRLPLVPEAKTLVPVGCDIFDRDQKLNPAAATAWKRLQTAAASRGIELQMVSAFRGISYQANLFRRKLSEGQSMARILSVSAAPGFSEHHSGRAIDITAPGSQPLDESFADSKAYEWLKDNAGVYGFKESFPRHNRHHISWEPWHWCYHHRPGT